MNRSHPTHEPALTDSGTPFVMRPASQAWEQLRLEAGSPHFVWVWFKPPAVPHGLVLRIPDELWGTYPQIGQLTLRNLLLAAGLDPSGVAMWQLYGMAFHGLNGTNPLLDQPIPPPVMGTVPEIVVIITVPSVGFLSPAAPPAAPISGAQSELFDRLDNEWTAVLEIEKDLDRLRKLLVDLSSRMKILNRDLSSDERLYSSREDKQDWQDARRFLRDSENKLRACVKEFDIGDPSSAGYRRALEQMYSQFVAPRVPFPGIEQVLGQFEAHRKLVMTLQGKMNSTYLAAVQNGERRAQQVLNRIAAKVREAQTKKTTLGVLLDG